MAKLTANELGLYDMSGSVSEWTNDDFGFYSDNTYEGGINPSGVSDGVAKVIRGGHRKSPASEITVYVRECMPSDEAASFLGFRMMIPTTVGVETPEREALIRIYPNPTKEILNLTEADRLSDLMIFHINGEIMMHLVSPIPSSIDIKSLYPGNYVVSAKEKSTGNTMFLKLVVTD